MSINEELSFTEYTLTEDTTDFIISFDRIGGSTDEVSILVNNTPIEDLVGYTVLQVNFSTWQVDPALPAGTVVRLARTTNLDKMVYVFTAGSKFIAKNVDSNFKQIQHSQQEIRDRQDKLEDDATALLLEVNDVKVIAEQAADDANEALDKVDEILNTGVIPATMILTSDGGNQQQFNDAQAEINLYGAKPYDMPAGGYPVGGLVRLENGDRVRSAVAGNTNDPNVDMSGWEFDGFSRSIYNPLNLIVTDAQMSNDLAAALNPVINKVSAAGGGTISVPDGEYWVNPTAAIVMKDNVHLRLGHETVIKALPTRSGGYDLIRVQDVENTKVSGGRLIGDRYTHLAPNGSYYKDWKPNTYYEAGEYIAQQYHGCLVLVSGTTGATRPDLQATGSTYVDGTCQYQYKENAGEWGYGIMIRGGKNNTVEDVEANDFWGDSLLISRSNTKDYAEKVTVKNFKADGSRRQGVTIGSVKGLRMTNLDLSNISGTLPMAGIDFEPDLGIQWLQDIVVDGVRTTNCEGEGIAVGFVTLGWRDWSSTIAYKANRDVVRYQGVMYQATQDNTYAVPSASSTAWKVLPDYDITQDRVSIEVKNHIDRGSRRGVWALGTQANQNVTGYVKFINSSYENRNNNNVFVQNNNGDGVQFYFEDPEFINNTQNSSDYHVRLSNAPADYSLGGVHLIRPKFKCKGINTECFYIYANNNNGLPNKNISIIDIVERPASIISPVNMVTRDTANVITSDRYNKLRLNSKVSQIIQNVAVQHEYYIDGTPTAFSINSVRKGQVIRVVNEHTGNATITMNIAGGNIQDVTNANTRSFTLAAGGSVELFAISSTLLRVVRSTGIHSSAKASRGLIPFPSTSFAANESKLIATVTTLTANRYADVVAVSSTMNLTGDIALSAVINTDGTISIYGTNLKASTLSYGAAGQYLNVVVS